MAGTSGMPFQQVATAPFSLHVAYTTQIEMSASLDDDASLKVAGYVDYEDARAHWPTRPTVTLQYSKDGRSGWKDAATLPVTIRHNKPSSPRRSPVPSPPEQQRLLARPLQRQPRPGDQHHQTRTPLPLRHARHRLPRLPDPVRKSRPITFSGTLQYKDGTTWKPLGTAPPPSTSGPAAPPRTTSSRDLGTDGHGHLVGMETAERRHLGRRLRPPDRRPVPQKRPGHRLRRRPVTPPAARAHRDRCRPRVRHYDVTSFRRSAP